MSDKAATFVYRGLAEMRAALKEFPEEFGEKVYELAVGAAHSAADEARSKYPLDDSPNWGKDFDDGISDSKHLRDSVVIQESKNKSGMTVTVKNTAHHAWLYDNGSAARHNANGANRGQMPATHVFGGAMQRARRLFVLGVKSVMEEMGMRVTGDA